MTLETPPEEVGLSGDRLAQVDRFLANLVEADKVPGAALLIARHGSPVLVSSFGRQYLTPDSPPVLTDTIFLVASVTKPVTAAAIVLLLERGQLLLETPVVDIIPEFDNHGKDKIQLFHLLTHTSGLPDMLPENQTLREQHQPLSEFVRRTCQLELAFEPGTQASYQSCGIAILGEIVERIEGISLPTFLKREIFQPLGMPDTSLGAAGLDTARIAHVRVPPEMEDTDWGWNTSYWWHFAAPWGGMFSTVGDMFRFCQTFLNGGKLGEVQLFSPATVDLMTRDHTGQRLASSAVGQSQYEGLSWGLGWRRHPAEGWSYFGNLISPGSYGHGGATGTLVWVDPHRQMVCVLFTTQPSAISEGWLGRCSNLVAAAAL